MANGISARVFTGQLADFISYMAKVLPDDIQEKLRELRQLEQAQLPKLIYDAMFENQKLAAQLDRPSCQDTGVIQFFAGVGTDFPLIDELPELLPEAVRLATRKAPLRHNAVQTFDEYNTGDNVGHRVPCVQWDLIPHSTELTLDVYMAGGGCSLPGKAMVLMPGAGYEGVVKFVLDVMTTYGLNACPPLLMGVGVGTSVEMAALLLPLGSSNPNGRAAQLEREPAGTIDSIRLGPQGLMGERSVLGVHIENAARHPSVIGVAVNVGCWSHRRGRIVFGADGTWNSPTHRETAL